MSTQTQQSEQTLLVTHPSMLAAPGKLALVLLLSLVVIGLPILAAWWIQCRSTTLTVTNRRTRLRRGLLSRHETEVWHDNVRNVQVEQTFTNRILGVGYIGISSAGQTGIEIEVRGIRDPFGVQALVNQYRGD